MGAPVGSALSSLTSVVGLGGGDGPKAPKLVTKQEYDRIAAQIGGFGSQGGIAGASRDAILSGYQVVPPPAPDLADEAVQKARQAARRKILMGGMTGPLDLTNGGAKALPGLSGV